MLEPSEVYGPVTYNFKMKTGVEKQDKSGDTWLDYNTDLLILQVLMTYTDMIYMVRIYMDMIT